MSTDHRTEAFEAMASREADLADLFARIDEGDEAAHEELSEYGLSLEWSRGRVRYVMSTGGPHDELSWEQGGHGDVSDLRFVYLPWFGREELTCVPPALRRMADNLADIVDGMGIESLPGFDAEDPHNMGTLTCPECGEECDDDGDAVCECEQPHDPDQEDIDRVGELLASLDADTEAAKSLRRVLAYTEDHL